MKKTISLFLFSLLLLPAFVNGAVFLGEEVVSFGKGERITENLYVAGAQVTISGGTTGDLYSAGGNVLVSGNIGEDATVVGGQIDIFGDIGGDLRVIGGEVKIDGLVSGELVVLGGLVHVLDGARILGDITIIGGAVIVNGELFGQSFIKADDIKIGGVLHSSSDFSVQKLDIEDGAQIIGDVLYTSPEEATISEGADVRGEITFQEKMRVGRDDGKRALLAFSGAFSAFKFVLTLIAAIVFVGIFSRLSQRVVLISLSGFGEEFLRGLGVLVLSPAVIFVLLFSILGILLAFLSGVLYSALLIIANVFAGVVFGGVIQKYVLKREVIEINWLTALYGVTLLFLIGTIPFLGWAVKAVFILVALGAVSHIVYLGLWKDRNKEAVQIE